MSERLGSRTSSVDGEGTGRGSPTTKVPANVVEDATVELGRLDIGDSSAEVHPERNPGSVPGRSQSSKSSSANEESGGEHIESRNTNTNHQHPLTDPPPTAVDAPQEVADDGGLVSNSETAPVVKYRDASTQVDNSHDEASTKPAAATESDSTRPSNNLYQNPRYCRGLVRQAERRFKETEAALHDAYARLYDAEDRIGAMEQEVQETRNALDDALEGRRQNQEGSQAHTGQESPPAQQECPQCTILRNHIQDLMARIERLERRGSQ